jgi:tRNA G18 (ribose-2'-O)-methylase SpoU
MLVAVLHNIRSVYNVGSIFRTADGAGFSRVYCCGVTPTPFDRFGHIRPDFAKVALGAERSVAPERRAATLPLLKKLKREGYAVLAVEQEERSVPFYKVAGSRLARPGQRGPDRRKIALVVGNEVRGLPPSILKIADVILEIPMHGAKESLNVAVAFGIAAYELASRR